MISTSGFCRLCAPLALVLAYCWSLAAPVAHAQPAPVYVYKCVEPSGRVLYTDSPCAGGQRIDIQAGAADPGAIARLEREQAMADRRNAERRAAQQREAERDAESERRIREHEAAAIAARAQAEVAGQAPGYYWGYGWPVYPGAFVDRKPPPPREETGKTHRLGRAIAVERPAPLPGRSSAAAAPRAHAPRGGSR